MIRSDIIDEILDSLKHSGSNIDYIKELKDQSVEAIKKDVDLKTVLYDIAYDIKYQTELFLSAQNVYGVNYIAGISTGIYLPADGKYELKIIGGSKSRDYYSPIDENTVFDLASITKLYTLVLLFKLEELGLIDLNQEVRNINKDIQGLENYTLNDLVGLYGILQTDEIIAEASSYEEAYDRFKNVYLVTSSKNVRKYNDLGTMIIADTIEKVVSEKLGENLKIDEIMDRFLFKPLQIMNATFNPQTLNITGNGDNLNMPHDQKSRVLNGLTGHAGIFANSDDFMRLTDGFNNGYLNPLHIKRIGQTVSKGSTRGNLGVYLKGQNGLSDTYTPQEFSNGSFSHQGWTGGIVVFDPNNKIHNSILVNAIYNGNSKTVNNKPFGYNERFTEYQSEITKRIMLMYVVKKYYNKYIETKENIKQLILV